MDTNYTIQVIDGEAIVDVIGLYVTGARILFMNGEGDESKARTALSYAKRALALFNDHIADNPSIGKEVHAQIGYLKCKVNQYVGLAYAELALEGERGLTQ